MLHQKFFTEISGVEWHSHKAQPQGVPCTHVVEDIDSLALICSLESITTFLTAAHVGL